MNVRTSVAAIAVLGCFATMVVAQSKETMRYTGRVIAVEADSITVARDTNRVFVVDESTEVKGKGVDMRSGEITDFGDVVLRPGADVSGRVVDARVREPDATRHRSDMTRLRPATLVRSAALSAPECQACRRSAMSRARVQ